LAFGAAVSTTIWLIVTIGLGAFFSLSKSFGETYGPLAGIVALLLWAFLAAFALLFGGAIAAQLEAVRAGVRETAGRDQGGALRARDRVTGHGDCRPKAMSLPAEQPTAAASSERGARLRRIVEGVIGVPATEGNRIDDLRNGDEIFPAMLEAIERAECTIDFLTFVYWEGTIGREFARRLADRARAGVRVRVLLDAWGAKPIEKALVYEMERGGRTRALVPAAATFSAERGEPPHPPQGRDRRRSGRLRRWRRDRR